VHGARACRTNGIEGHQRMTVAKTPLTARI
jgi:hypothetical protein